MSVVGIDLGNANSYVAAAKKSNIEVVLNEVSNRATPSLVGFGPNCRFIGESGKSNEIGNLKSTVNSLKRLIGLSFNDPDVQVEKSFVTAELVDHNGSVGAKVSYQGEQQVFSITQLVAMLLGKLRDVARNATQGHVSDVVISVPAYFTDQQRRALLDASEIAGLNCLKLMNESTAAALEYGINRTDMPEDKPRHVCFVDVGHSAYSVAIGAFMKGKLEMKAVVCDKHFGGRLFDEVLVDHFCKEFKTKYGIDIKSNAKGLFRLRTACERVKKVLSTNAVTILNVESIMEDRDVSAEIKRSVFEELAQGLLSRVEEPLIEALKIAGLRIDQIDSIEVVGGSTRIPAIKERISRFFGRELSTTMNQDEAVARGCAFQCATLSPLKRARQFQVHDISLFPIKLCYEPTPDAPKDREVEIFKKNSLYPATRVLTFYRSEPFDVEIKYADPEYPQRAWIGRATIQKVAPNADGSAATIKVTVKMNIHGIVNVDNAQVHEEQIVDENAMETEATAETAEAARPPPVGEPSTGKKKKIVKKCDVPVFVGTSSLSTESINNLRSVESEMYLSDKLVADTAERKNALEEYIYDMKGKLEGILSEYVIDIEKAQLMDLLTQTEDWLYGEGENTTKGVYVERLERLQKCGKAIIERFKEYEEVPYFIAALRDTANDYIAKATCNDAIFDHISSDEKSAIIEECQRKLRWAEEMLRKAQAAPKTQRCPISISDISKEHDALVQMAKPILTRPKPPPPALPKDPLQEEVKKSSAAEGAPAVPENEVPNMDVD